MAGKYSIDDILAEIDERRGKTDAPKSTISITSEIDSILDKKKPADPVVLQKPKHTEQKPPPIRPNFKEERPVKQSKDVSVTEILDTTAIKEREKQKSPSKQERKKSPRFEKLEESKAPIKAEQKPKPQEAGTEVLAKPRAKAEARSHLDKPQPHFEKAKPQEAQTEVLAKPRAKAEARSHLDKPQPHFEKAKPQEAGTEVLAKPRTKAEASPKPKAKPTPKRSDIFYEKAKPVPRPLIEDISVVEEKEPPKDIEPLQLAEPKFQLDDKTVAFDRKKPRKAVEDTDNIEIFDDRFLPPTVDGMEKTMVIAAPRIAEHKAAEQRRINEETLLKQDIEAEQPDELIESINPYEVKKRAKEELQRMQAERTMVDELSGDTQGIAGDDLKIIAEQAANENLSALSTAEADVKAYIPVIEKPHPEPPEEVDMPKITHNNTALIESLNKAIRERRENERRSAGTLPLEAVAVGGQVPEGSNVLNIDYKTQILKDTTLMPAVADPIETEQKMQELNAKRKRKIKDFVLEDNDEDDDAPEEVTDEFEGFDVSEQIWSDLEESHKGLKIRFGLLFLLTAFLVVVTACNDFGVHMAYRVLGIDMSFLDHRFGGYVLMQIIVGVLGLGCCSTVIVQGLKRLFTGKGDSDSICAISSVVSVVGAVPLLLDPDLVITGQISPYVSVGLTALLFNTIGKLLMINRAKRNFRIVSSDNAKYYAEIVKNDELADAFTKGTLSELPVLASMRKTEFLTDFLKSSYCPDLADRYSKTLTPIALGISVLLGIIAYFFPSANLALDNSLSWAMTVATGTLSAFSSFSIMFIVNFPLARASKALSKKDSAVLGYQAAVTFSDVNSVLVDASSLFTAGSIAFCNIKRCQKKETLNAIAIDEAIITAASLAIKCNSILSSMFYNMIAGKSELLYDVENCIYEVNMGITGWIGNRRIMLGNREQMKHHDIPVPDIRIERKYASPKGEVVYLAVSGEAVAMFFIEIIPNPEIKRWMQELDLNDMSVVVRTRDSLVTVAKVADVFDVSPEKIRILPFNLHQKFDECTRYSSRGDGSISCNGTFTSFASALIAAKKLVKDISLTSMSIFVSSFLALILSTVFMLFQLTEFFAPSVVTIYNMFWLTLMLIIQSARRYG